jgi:putative ABC transport system permease protein
LGGDVSVHLVHREATAERTRLPRRARTRLRSDLDARDGLCAQNGAEADRQLIELKAVDGAYPLYGSVTLAPQIPLRDAFACTPIGGKTICGAVVEQTLLDRLHLSRGGLMRIGSQDFRITAMLANEPDRISGGFTLGPHVLMSDAGLARTGLVTLGSLIEYSYRVAMPANASIAEFKDQAQKAFPDSGWEIPIATMPRPASRNSSSR